VQRKMTVPSASGTKMWIGDWDGIQVHPNLYLRREKAQRQFLSWSTLTKLHFALN